MDYSNLKFDYRMHFNYIICEMQGFMRILYTLMQNFFISSLTTAALKAVMLPFACMELPMFGMYETTKIIFCDTFLDDLPNKFFTEVYILSKNFKDSKIF